MITLRNIIFFFVVLVIAIFLVGRMQRTKKVVPDAPVAESSASSSGGSCVPMARQASDALGSGLGRFVNPPVDLAAFEDYRSGVEAKIRAAEAQCSCLTEQCVSMREAMSELRGVLNQLDSAMRTGMPLDPGIVQAIDSIDTRINAAG